MNHAVDSLAYFALLGLLCGVVSFRLGFRIGRRVGLPLTQTLLGFLAFAASWRAGGSIAAACAAGGWAVGTTVVGVPAFARDPGRATEVVFGAQDLRRATIGWLATGRGPRAGVMATVSRLVRLLSLFLIAGTVSAGVLALGLGTLLLNAMNACAGGLIAGARRPWVARWLVWNGWSIARVVAFAALGSACAAPLATRLGYPPASENLRLLLIVGGAALLADLLLEMTLSETYRRRLAAAVDLGPAPAAFDAPGSGPCAAAESGSAVRPASEGSCVD